MALRNAPLGTVPKRFRGLEEMAGTDGARVFVAASARSRLLGLAFLDDLPKGVALLIPGCASIHTFGMRFPLDAEFLDADGRRLRICAAVPPRRMVSCRGAAAVLERRGRLGGAPRPPDRACV